VIAARDGAFVEYISHGHTGMLFCPGDAQDLADTIQMLACNPARAAAMAQGARQYCRKAFDIHTFADSVCDYLHKVHGQPRRASEAALSAERQTLDQPQTAATGG
jgi:glycosyltransferase involved in cell wall biosynthesis